MITISQVASFAGVTVRAVRHYHARGLLPEPERDVSGYRRYDAQAAIELIRIRTLAEAGVPLSRVGELLHAGPDEFAAALEDIDRDLRATIRRAQEHRRRVAELAGGEALGLRPSVVGYLELLRGFGVSERTVAMEREGWVMVSARLPDQVDDWIVEKRKGLEDPAFRNLYLAFDAAYEYPVDDPRLAGVADALVDFVRVAEASGNARPDPAVKPDEAMVALIDDRVLDASPAWRRIVELVHGRGLSGWTEIHDT